MSKSYPGIAAACLLIALDNGGIHRGRSEQQQSREFNKWLAKQDYPNLHEIDAWLASLSKADLDQFCSGGTGEPETEAIRANAPAFTDDLLNSYFDEVC
jgi:hypothetical protein